MQQFALCGKGMGVWVCGGGFAAPTNLLYSFHGRVAPERDLLRKPLALPRLPIRDSGL